VILRTFPPIDRGREKSSPRTRKWRRLCRLMPSNFQRIAKTPPRPGPETHNESLWIIVGTHMSCRNMCRIAAQCVPLYATCEPEMCRIAAQFVIILTAICAISVAYVAYSGTFRPFFDERTHERTHQNPRNRRTNPRIRRTNPRSCERTRAHELSHPAPRSHFLSIGCRLLFYADMKPVPRRPPVNEPETRRSLERTWPILTGRAG
jgi:hypothetical protein